MKKFVYVEFEGKGLDEESFILSEGYLNIDYIITIPIPFSERLIEIHTGVKSEDGITSGTKYYKLTEKTFDNLIKELGLKSGKDE